MATNILSATGITVLVLAELLLVEEPLPVGRLPP